MDFPRGKREAERQFSTLAALRRRDGARLFSRMAGLIVCIAAGLAAEAWAEPARASGAATSTDATAAAPTAIHGLQGNLMLAAATGGANGGRTGAGGTTGSTGGTDGGTSAGGTTGGTTGGAGGSTRGDPGGTGGSQGGLGASRGGTLGERGEPGTYYQPAYGVWPPRPRYGYRRPRIYEEPSAGYDGGPGYGLDAPDVRPIRRFRRPLPPRLVEEPPPRAHGRKSLPLQPIVGQQAEPMQKKRPMRVAAPPFTPAKLALPPKVAPSPLAPPAANASVLPDEILFELAPPASSAAPGAIARRYGLILLRADRLDLLETTIYRMRIADRRRTVDQVVRALRADTRIASAQGNGKFKLQVEQATSTDLGAAGVSDPPLTAGPGATLPPPPARAAQPAASDATGLQWAADKMQLSTVHQVTRGRDVVVAVIDSGIDVTHPELAGSSVQLLNVAETPFKPHGHGTAMAGAIMAHAKLLGVAPEVRILEIRAFDGETVAAGAEGTTDHVLRGLEAAYDGKAAIINMSFAGPADALLSRMLAALHQKGIIVIAAAGNGGAKSPPLFPAADPNVIAVTATDIDDGLYKEANQGAYIHLAAPGVDVLEPAPGNSYQLTSGTSVAAAHVTGVVALLLAHDPRLAPDRVQSTLAATASKRLTNNAVEEIGPRLVNAYRALQALDGKPVEDQPPTSAGNRLP